MLSAGPAGDALVDAYDVGASAVVVDVGCGDGSLLAAVLRRRSAARGILFELTDVVTGEPRGPATDGSNTAAATS
jgi:hypothetical protein